MPRVSMVVRDDPRTHVHVAVVASQIAAPNGKTWIIASSVIEIATDKNEDLLVTHDILAATDLASLAHSIAFPVGGMLIRLTLGLGLDQ